MKGLQEMDRTFTTVMKDLYLSNELALRVAQATKTCPGSHGSIHYRATIFQPPRDGLLLGRG